MRTSKQQWMLGLLRARSVNTFEAHNLGDTCLHSTVAELRRSGYVIGGDWEEVPNRFGGKTRVMRYRLIAEPETIA